MGLVMMLTCDAPFSLFSQSKFYPDYVFVTGSSLSFGGIFSLSTVLKDGGGVFREVNLNHHVFY